jgi:uncharacterized protein (DUF1499 family)
MGLFTAFTRNWADTDGTADPTLKPVDLPAPLNEALVCVEAIVGNLPRWHIEAVDVEAGRLTATRRTRLWGFIDDITIRLEPSPRGTRVHAHSKSRVGAVDFGQNRRNLLELLTILQERSARWELKS